MIKSICILADGYPTPTDPFFPFVEQIALAMVDEGINVTVIAPQSYTKHLLRGKELHPKIRKYHQVGENCVTVFQPAVPTLGRNHMKFNSFFHNRAVDKVLKRLPQKPDACYGHFWHSGYGLYKYASKNNLPLFVASGESDVEAENSFDLEKAKPFFDYVKGVICVSVKNKEESISAGFTTEKKCIIAPNSVNSNLFRKLDKKMLRAKYNIDENAFIVAFTGAFEHRKGSKRMADAITSLNDSTIKSFFIGRGLDDRLEDPDCDGILFKGPLDHSVLPEYLNMADVFCLPTLKEGCCNAIVEALACGLPVISSNRSFNFDILDELNSIMIDPMDVAAIAKAIKSLKDDKELREQLSEGALKKSISLTIDQRAKTIIGFINNKI